MSMMLFAHIYTLVIVTWIYIVCFQSKTRTITTEDRGKERQLQKKVTELNTQITRLDKRVTILKTENESLVSLQWFEWPLSVE